MRFMLVGVSLMLTVSSCGGGEMSLTEYVDRINAINGQAIQRYEALLASPQGEVLVAEGAQLVEYTPQDLQIGLEGVIEIAAEVTEAVAGFDPPQQVAEFHYLLFDDKFTFYEEALAARAAIAVDWEELSASSEMEAYRTAIAEDKQLCLGFQAQLDATVERANFADTPWLPEEMKEIVDAVLGCPMFPEKPEDVYRPAGGLTP